jgi:hypothetical protein
VPWRFPAKAVCGLDDRPSCRPSASAYVQVGLPEGGVVTVTTLIGPVSQSVAKKIAPSGASLLTRNRGRSWPTTPAMEAAACAKPASGYTYARREPEKTALFQTIQRNLLTFEQQWTDGAAAGPYASSPCRSCSKVGV